MAPHTILFIAANPVGTDRRALGEQARAVQAELERAGRRDCFQFETRWAAQPLDLLREMVKHKPTVVHFCGGRVIGGGKGAPPVGGLGGASRWPQRSSRAAPRSASPGPATPTSPSCGCGRAWMLAGWF